MMAYLAKIKLIKKVNLKLELEFQVTTAATSSEASTTTLWQHYVA